MKQPNIILKGDASTLIETKTFPHAHFPFQQFNQAQSSVCEFYHEDVNCVIAAPTGVGKTEMGELFLSYDIRAKKRKGIYLSPLRSLSQEKVDSWIDKDHHFSDLNISIATGDYRITPDRKEELKNADLILMTSEMLNSLSRQFATDKNSFLNECGTLVCDEAHLLTTKERGAHLESGIMKFTAANPDCRIVMLSATMPNVSQIGEWASTLNGKPTYVVQSSYRPCPLEVHYTAYNDCGNYDWNELAKVQAALRILHKYPSDKFLFFVHTKKTGNLMLAHLRRDMIECEYHNADLPKHRRIDIEHRFRNDPKMRALVATSTVAWGLNLPARRVVIVGIHRGLTEVENYDIDQMNGRAGRPRYDPCGDAYVLVPKSKFEKHVTRLKTPTKIESQLQEPKSMAFHLVHEVYQGNIQKDEQVEEWYDRTLCAYQNKQLDKSVVGNVMTRLKKSGCIRSVQESYEATAVGKISSWYYYPPYDVADLLTNWNKVFQYGKQDDDVWISMALGNTDTSRGLIVSNAEREAIGTYFTRIKTTQPLIGENPSDGAIKASYVYYMLLRGEENAVLGSVMRGFQADFDRVIQVLATLDLQVGKWGQSKYLHKLQTRMKYGIVDTLTDLVAIKGIGRIKANKLWNANLRTYSDIANNVEAVAKALRCKVSIAQQIAEEARSFV